ncbi:hypothetical protein HK099_007149 [Clydaea vesicula]|uniref:Nuclear movement protein nudC n=1 Tax=Clydaea vesicula TaxID=447962 RepID=A0AAD5U5K5_9FUNG|nr:hypothetical protein HK099_007149 [Clydaea vesicula]KAJ3394245.1 hypothetical protein HDU92_007104 [Lobulomyces angularis]
MVELSEVSDDKEVELSEEEQKIKDQNDKLREEEEQNSLPYRWKQTLYDVDVTFKVPAGTKGKQLDIVIKTDTFKVGFKGQPPITEGKFSKPVKSEDSTWLIDNENLEIHLEKVNKQEWWENVIVGAPKIDTKKIQPENSKLSDLDGETRSMVEKMMFDQKQKSLGLPSSEDLKKMEALEKFKKQHPEMDFSQAKIN